MIDVDSVTKRYGRSRVAFGRRPALDGVSLRIERGEIHAVVGPNGAGKSTLFALVLGFLHPTAGEVSVDGEEPGRYVRRHGAAYLPERFTLPAAWNVADALDYLARLERLGDEANARTRRAIRRFGLETEVETRIGALSRGTLQRVGLAQALLAPRELIVLDEPTEGLDPIWRLRLRDAIATLRAEQRTVLLASHDLAEVERIADRASVMENGRIRETLDLRAPAARMEYVIRLAAASPAMTDAFPGAVPSGDGASAFRVEVESVAELSTRLAALIDGGGVVAVVVPVGAPLEERVRRILGEEQGG
jgi:ABC-type multidrug transport system ATPase subunit